jgi:hypothetical protein
VVPGDTLVMEVELIKFMEKFGIAKISGRCYVDGDLAVEAKEMTFALAYVVHLDALFLSGGINRALPQGGTSRHKSFS